MRILGLDISTSTIGVSIVNDNGDMELCQAWDLRPYKDLYSKADVVKNNLQQLISVDEIWRQ